MKKTLAILVMAIFLISMVPFALAEGGLGEGLGEKISSIGEKVKSEITGKECIEDKDCSQTKCIGAEPKCEDGKCVVLRCGNANLSVVSAGNSLAIKLKQREIAKEKLEKARTNYEEAKLRLITAKLNASMHRAEFMEGKAKLKECKQNDSETCKQIKAEVQENAQQYLIETADRIIAALEKIKAKAQESEDLTEEEVAEIVSDIDARIAILEEAKNTLETSENKEEIIEAAKTIKQEWNKVRVKARLHIEQMRNAKLGNIIARAEHLQERLEKIKEKLQEQGQNVSDLDEVITTFKTQIETAKEKYQNASGLFKQAKAEGNAELVKQAQEAHKEAEQAIKEAHKTLKEIVKAIKEKNNTVLEEEEPDEEGEQTE